MSGQEDALLVIRPRAGQAPRMEQALAGALAGKATKSGQPPWSVPPL